MAALIHGVEHIVVRAGVGMFQSDRRGPAKVQTEQAAEPGLDDEHGVAALCARRPSGVIRPRHSDPQSIWVSGSAGWIVSPADTTGPNAAAGPATDDWTVATRPGQATHARTRRAPEDSLTREI